MANLTIIGILGTYTKEERYDGMVRVILIGLEKPVIIIKAIDNSATVIGIFKPICWFG